MTVRAGGSDGPRRWWLACVAVAGCIGAAAIAAAGFQPDPYLEHVRRVAPPHPYPLGGVAVATGIVAVHAVLLGALFGLRPLRFLRCRAAIAVALAIGVAAFGVSGSLHAPPFVIAFVWWALVVALAVVLGALWVVVAESRGAARARSASRDAD